MHHASHCMEFELELTVSISIPQWEPIHIFCDGIYGQNNRNSTFDYSFILYIGCIIFKKIGPKDIWRCWTHKFLTIESTEQQYQETCTAFENPCTKFCNQSSTSEC